MSHDLIKELVSDILDLDDIMLSVNSGSGICEVRTQRFTYSYKGQMDDYR